MATPTGQVFRWQTRIMMQPERDQRRGGKTEFLRAEQRGDDHVAAGLELAVGLDGDAAAEIVEHERLVRLGQAEFPRRARVLDARQRRRARAAVVAADEHHVGMRLGDAGGDGADADFGDQFHADARVAVGVLQVVDQLRQVFDGINVVVRRRRNQADAGRGERAFWRSTDKPLRRAIRRLRRAWRPGPS